MIFHIFSYVDDNQNSRGTFTNIVAMRAVDHGRKTKFDWPYVV